MESAASKNARPTRETDSKNRSCLTHGIVKHTSADPEIGSENLVTVEREIFFETESRLRDGIDIAY